MHTAANDYQKLFAEGPWNITAISIEIGSDLVVNISLRTELGKHARISFIGVCNLRLVQATENWPLSLVVVEIGDRQWEDLNFGVEADQGDFAFYCREITIQR